MATSLLDKIIGIVGLDPEVEEAAPYEEDDRKNAVLSVHSHSQLRVTVFQPLSFEDVQSCADCLKNRGAVIVNLEQATPELRRRILDFLSGAVYILGGDMERVGDDVTIFVPNNIDITKDLGYSLPRYSKQRYFD